MIPKMYNSRMDVETAYVPTFVDWYKVRHGPDAVGVGQYSANGYQAVVGSPWICNFYEIIGIELFDEKYDRMRASDPDLDEIVTKRISNHSLMIYDQVLTEGIPDSANDDPDRPSLSSALTAPAVSTIRFDPGNAVDRVVEWYRDVEFPRLRSAAGFVRGRVCVEDGKHPVYPGTEPPLQIILEWGRVPDAIGQGGPEDVLGRHRDALGQLDRASYNVVRHEYTLRHPDSWAA